MQGQGQPSQLASPGLPPAADLQELLNEIQELKAGLLGDSVTHDNPTFEGPPWEHQRTLQSSDGLRLDIPMEDLDDSLEAMVARDARLQYILSPQAEEQVVRSGFRFEQDSSSPQRAVPGPTSLERLRSAGVSPAALPAASGTPVTPEAGASRVASQQYLTRDAAYATATSSRYAPTATPDAAYATAASSGLTPVAAQLPPAASHTTPSPSATNAAAAQARVPAATPLAAGTARKVGSRIARPAGVATPGAATGRPAPAASGLPTPSTAPSARTSSFAQPHHAASSTSGASTATSTAAHTGSAVTSTARTGHAAATPPPSTRSKLAAAVNAIGAIATASASRTASRIPARHAASTTASPGSSVGPLRTGSGSVSPSVASAALGSSARKRPPQSGPDGVAGAPIRKVATPTGASSAAYASPSSHAHNVTSPTGGRASRTPSSAAFGSGSKIPVRAGHTSSTTSQASRIASPAPAASPAAAATPTAAAEPPSAVSTAASTPQVAQVAMYPVVSSPDEMICEVSHPSLTLPTIATADLLGGESIESMLRDDPALASWLATAKQVDTAAAAAVDASKATAAAGSGAAALQRRTSDELLRPLNVAMADTQGGNTWLDDDADTEMSLLMAGGTRSGCGDGDASPAAEVVAEAVAAAAAVTAYTPPPTPPAPAPVQAPEEQAEVTPPTQPQASQLATTPGNAVRASRERMGSTVCKVRELLGLDDQQEGHELNSEELWRNITVEANSIFSARGGPAATAAAVAIAATEPAATAAAAGFAAAAAVPHVQPEAEDAAESTAGDVVAPQRSMSEALSRAMSMQQGPPAHEVALSDESFNHFDNEVAAPLADEVTGAPQDNGGDREGSPGLEALAAEAAAAAAAVTAGGTAIPYGGGQPEALAEGGASRLLMHQASSASSLGYTASVAFEATMISRQLAGYDSRALRACPPGEEAIMEEGEELVSPGGMTAAIAVEALAASGSAVAFDDLPELPEPAPAVPAALIAEDEMPVSPIDTSSIAAAVLPEASAAAVAMSDLQGGQQATVEGGDDAGLAAAPASAEGEVDAAEAASPLAPPVGAVPDAGMEVDDQGSAAGVPDDSTPFASAAMVDATAAMAVVAVKAPKDSSDMAVDDDDHRDLSQIAVDALVPPPAPMPDTSTDPGDLATRERSSRMAVDGPGDGGEASAPTSQAVSPVGLSALVGATAKAAEAPEPPHVTPEAGGSDVEGVLAATAAAIAAAGAAPSGVDAADGEGRAASLDMAIVEVLPPSMAGVALPAAIEAEGLSAEEPGKDECEPASGTADAMASHASGAPEHPEAAGLEAAKDAAAAYPVAYPVAVSDVSDGGSVPAASEQLEEAPAGDDEAVLAAVAVADEPQAAAIAEAAPLHETGTESQPADAVGVDVVLAAVAAAEEVALGANMEVDADDAAASTESEPAAALAAVADEEVGELQTGISAPMEAAGETLDAAAEHQAAPDLHGDPMLDAAPPLAVAAAATAAAVVGFQEAASMDLEEAEAAPAAAYAAPPCVPMDVEDASASLVASSKLAIATKLPEAPPAHTVEARGAPREVTNMAIDEPQQGFWAEAAAASAGTVAAAAVIPGPQEPSAHEVEGVAAGLAAPTALAGAAERLTGAADVAEEVIAAPAAAEPTLESAEWMPEPDAAPEAEAADGAAGPSAEPVVYPAAEMEERAMEAEAHIRLGTAEATLAAAAVAVDSQSGSSCDMEEAQPDSASDAADAPEAADAPQAADAAEPLADAALHADEADVNPSGVDDPSDQGGGELLGASSSDADTYAAGSPPRAAAAPPRAADLIVLSAPEDANTAVADATSPQAASGSDSDDSSVEGHGQVMPAGGYSPIQAATTAGEPADAPAAAAPAPQAVARSADEHFSPAVAAAAPCTAPASAEDAEITDAADTVVGPEAAIAGDLATAAAGEVESGLESEGARAADPDAEMSGSDSEQDEQMYDAEEDGFEIGQAAEVAGHTHSAPLSAHSGDGNSHSGSSSDDDSGDGVPQELRRKVPAGAGPAIVAAAAATAAADATPQRVKYPRVEPYSGHEVEADACTTAPACASAGAASTVVENAPDEEAARSPAGPIAEGVESGRGSAAADTTDPTAGPAEDSDAKAAEGAGPSEAGGEVAALGSIPSNASKSSSAFACANSMSIMSHLDGRAGAEVDLGPAPSGLPQCVSGSLPSDTFSLGCSEMGSRMFSAMAGAAAFTAGQQAATARAAPETGGSFSDASFVTARGMSLLAGVGATGGAWHGAEDGGEGATAPPVDSPRPEAAAAAVAAESQFQAPAPERAQADASPCDEAAPQQPAPGTDGAPAASQSVSGVSPAPVKVPAAAHPAPGGAGEQQPLLHAWQVLVPVSPGGGHTEPEGDGVPHVRGPLGSKLSMRSMLSGSSRLSRVSSRHDDEAASSTGASPTVGAASPGAYAFNLGQGAAAVPEGIEDGSDKTDDDAPPAIQEADGGAPTEAAEAAAAVAVAAAAAATAAAFVNHSSSVDEAGVAMAASSPMASMSDTEQSPFVTRLPAAAAATVQVVSSRPGPPGGASGALDGEEHLVPAWKLVQADGTSGSSPTGGAPAAAAASLGCRRSLRSIPVSSSGSRLKRSASQASFASISAQDGQPDTAAPEHAAHGHRPATAAGTATPAAEAAACVAVGAVPDAAQYDSEDEEGLQPAWKVMAVAGALPDTPEAVAAARGSPLGSQPSFRSSRAGSSRLRRASAPDGEGFEGIAEMWRRAAPAGDGMEVDPQPQEAAASPAAAPGGGGDDQPESAAADGVAMGAVVLPLRRSRSRTLPGNVAEPVRSGSAGSTPIASQLGPSHSSHSADGFPPPPLLRGGSGGRMRPMGASFGGVHRFNTLDSANGVRRNLGTVSESGSLAAMLAARASSRRHSPDSIGTVPLPRRSSTGGGDPNVDAMRQAWQVLPLPVSPGSNTPGSGGGGSIDSGAGLAAAGGSTAGAPSAANMLASMRSSSRLSRMSSGIPEDLLAELRIQAHAAVGHLQGPHRDEHSGGGLADMTSSVEDSATQPRSLKADAGAAAGASSTTAVGEGAAGDGAGGLMPAWKVLPLRVPPPSSAGAPPEIHGASPSASRMSALGGRPALVATRSTNASSRLAVSSNKAPALQVSFEPVSPAGRSPGPALPEEDEEEEDRAAEAATTRAAAPATMSLSPRPALNLPHADSDQEEPVVHAWKLVPPSPSGGQASSPQVTGADAAGTSGSRQQHVLGSRRSLKSLGSVGGSRLSRASIRLEDYVDNAYSEAVGADDAGAGFMEVADTANQNAVAAAVAAAAAAAEEMAPKDEAGELPALHSERSSAPAAIGGVLHGNYSSHDVDTDAGGGAAEERRSLASRASPSREGAQPPLARGNSAGSLKAGAEGSQDSGGAGRALNSRASWRSGSTSGNSRVSRVSSCREAAPWDLEEIREEDPEGAAPQQEQERPGVESSAGRAAAAAAAQPALTLGQAHSGSAEGEEALSPAWKVYDSPFKAAEAAGSRLSAPGAVRRPSCANSTGSSRLSHMASLASEAGLADIVEEGADGAAAAAAVGGATAGGVEQTPPVACEQMSSGRAPPPAPSAGAGRIGSPVPSTLVASHATPPSTTAPPLIDEDGAPLLPAWKVLAPHPAADAPEADGGERTSPLGTTRQAGLRAQRSGSLGHSRLSRMTSGLAEEEPTGSATSPSGSPAAAAVASGGAEHPLRADAAAAAATTGSEAPAAATPTATTAEQTVSDHGIAAAGAAAAGPASASSTSSSASGDCECAAEAAGPSAGPLVDASGQASQAPSTPGVESKSTTQEHSNLTLANLPSAHGSGIGGAAPRVGSGQFGSSASGPHAPVSGAAPQTPLRAAAGAIKEEEAVPSPGTPQARPQSPAGGAGAEAEEPAEVSPADVTPEVMPASEEGSPVAVRAVERSASSAGDVPQVVVPVEAPVAPRPQAPPRPQPPRRKRGGFLACFACFGGSAGDDD